MPSESAASDTGRAPLAPAHRRRRYKRRELKLADGGSLVLNADGSIDQLADDRTTTHSWAPDDADWPRHAFRFGLRPQGATIAPHDRRGG